MTYQAVVRNANNELVMNQQIGIQISIIEDNANGPIAYSERHTAQTNANALFSIVIGTGTPLLITSMADIKWDKHNHYMKIEIDPTGGTNYTITGTQQLLSVPYSLYSNKSKYVDTALYATSATSAIYSTYADSSLNSYSAIYSTYTDSSWVAIYAINAIYSDTTLYAYNAVHSDTAGYSAIANSALNAIYSDTSLFAANSNHTIYADTALYLMNAQTSDTAKFAYSSDTANYANSATAANTATSALTANRSDTSLYAANSNHAIYADTALYLMNAQTSDTAKFAYSSDTANYALNTNHANSANYADSSNYNHLSNRPVGTNRGDILYWEPNDSSWHIVPAGNVGETLTMDTNHIPYWHADTIALATVVTDSVTNVTATTAAAVSTVTDDGGSTFVFSGVCWDTAHNPTIASSHTIDYVGIGAFTSIVEKLSESDTLYIRAYATNEAGTSYGNEIIVLFSPVSSCEGISVVIDYDFNFYHTIEIGNQCWLKENMRCTHYADGTEISQGSSTSSDEAFWYYPGNSQANKATYGLLYNWSAVMNRSPSSLSNPSGVSGVCPMGWHVPSDAEWTQLENYVSSQNQYQCGGTSSYIAKALAAKTGWATDSTPCAVGNTPSNNNSVGFCAIPASYFYGGYVPIGMYAIFWSSTEVDLTTAWGRCFYPYYAYVVHYFDNKYDAFSVRCVKD